jgi:hypothetical protein
LRYIQSILAAVAVAVIILVILLELFDSHAYVLCFIAYSLGALAYLAEIVAMVLRVKEHEDYKADCLCRPSSACCAPYFISPCLFGAGCPFGYASL